MENDRNDLRDESRDQKDRSETRRLETCKANSKMK